MPPGSKGLGTSVTSTLEQRQGISGTKSAGSGDLLNKGAAVEERRLTLCPPRAPTLAQLSAGRGEPRVMGAPSWGAESTWPGWRGLVPCFSGQTSQGWAGRGGRAGSVCSDAPAPCWVLFVLTSMPAFPVKCCLPQGLCNVMNK